MYDLIRVVGLSDIPLLMLPRSLSISDVEQKYYSTHSLRQLAEFNTPGIVDCNYTFACRTLQPSRRDLRLKTAIVALYSKALLRNIVSK